ncbi:putative quinol monooxygenase [Bowmanella dokdonensis]|uniref:Antibiotic biosynthesis monooxygenase n=1 Tax=Bowmanella dokdonensis TaxID=751969 RepID=A0A939IPP9_9ALTE|nr:antibiotic biosynthesis monooxygenase [Bowmanella dokdonensis]MBN7827668.1 antibiotic biosynthesis monooxygenase [Bowmanella dokdonensis]
MTMPASPPLTLLKVFRVEPENQSRLVQLLSRATEEALRSAPGFVWASLEKSRDGRKVTWYVQWQSEADYQAMREDPDLPAYFQEIMAIASHEAEMYEPVKLFEPGRFAQPALPSSYRPMVGRRIN